MGSNNFTKVFDVLDSGFRNWSFSAFGLIFVFIGLAIFFAPGLIKSIGITYFNFESKWQKFFRYYFLVFSILWTAITFYSTYSSHMRHQNLMQRGGCQTAEGQVENFVPMPYSGHAYESFSVSGIQFKYSDYIVTDGFNNTSSHGGPINKDSYVRICYDPTENQILRLEIRDYKGQIKDYSSAENLFPDKKDFQEIDQQNLTSKLPLYGNLFFILYLLDFLALLNLFIPYIKTYFCLKILVVSDCAVPLSFQREKKIKLSNSILYWDNVTKGIWLRPRGFNLLRVQLFVVKLNVDELGKNITSQEIRFSSGFPIIVILLFWTTYQFFTISTSNEAKGLSPAQFIGFASVIFIILGFINIRMLQTRMEKLVQDSIDEIRKM